MRFPHGSFGSKNRVNHLTTECNPSSKGRCFRTASLLMERLTVASGGSRKRFLEPRDSPRLLRSGISRWKRDSQLFFSCPPSTATVSFAPVTYDSFEFKAVTRSVGLAL